MRCCRPRFFSAELFADSDGRISRWETGRTEAATRQRTVGIAVCRDRRTSGCIDSAIYRADTRKFGNKMRICLLLCLVLGALVADSGASPLRDLIRTLTGVPRSGMTTASSSSVASGENDRLPDPEADPGSDEVKLKRDVALRLQRYAQITSEKVSDDIAYICRELCQVAATCPPDCDGYIQPPWGLRRFFD